MIVILISGAFILGKNMKTTQKPAMKITQKTPIQTVSSPTPDPTANWETYTNKFYSFKYPSNWGRLIEDTQDDFQEFYPTDQNGKTDAYANPSISIEITNQNPLPCGENCPISQYYNNYKKINVGSYAGFSYGELEPTIGSKCGCSTEKVILSSKNNYFVINFRTNSKSLEKLSSSDEKLFSQILSTFKFTDQNQTPSISPVVTNNMFEVKELGIQFQISADLKDLVYIMTNSNGVIAANFSTTSLTNLDQADGGSYCNATNHGLGIISKVSQLGHDLSDSKQIGSYYYIWNHPQATCSDKSNVSQLQSRQTTALAQAFKTLELIK